MHNNGTCVLRQAGDTTPDPRKQFIKDLTDFPSPHHRSGTEILLMGDFDETLGVSNRGLDSIVNKFNLLDLLPYHHGMEGEIETYSMLDFSTLTNLASAVLGNVQFVQRS